MFNLAEGASPNGSRPIEATHISPWPAEGVRRSVKMTGTQRHGKPQGVGDAATATGLSPNVVAARDSSRKVGGTLGYIDLTPLEPTPP